MLAENSKPSFPDRSKIERLQLQKLEALLQTILPANPFYARKLAALGKALSFSRLDSYGRVVPFTTKHELVKDRLSHPPYGTNLTFPLQDYVRCHQTSGSTTSPIRWLDTAESWSQIVDNWVRILQAAGVKRQDRFCFAFSFGPFLGFWSAFEAALRLGCFCFPAGAMSSLARVQTILDNEITVLCCTPTYALHLGETARKITGPTHSRVRLIIVAGEAGGSIPATRARIQSLWPNAFVFDHHGMTEVGPVTYQCPRQPGVLHVLENAYLPEVIDPQTGAPLECGPIGELVLTTLDRSPSPLLRYRTGDLVKPRPLQVCACGRSDLALEGGILGRSDDMVVVRGVNVFPSTIEEIVRSYPEISEYRVKLDCRDSMAELSLEIEPVNEDADHRALKHRIEQSLQLALNLRIPVEVCPHDSLPRFEMKAKRWIRITE